jgi:hypothetical protein
VPEEGAEAVRERDRDADVRARRLLARDRVERTFDRTRLLARRAEAARARPLVVEAQDLDVRTDAVAAVDGAAAATIAAASALTIATPIA